MAFVGSFCPPETVPLREWVLKHLRLEIFKGLPVGTQLVESELAKQMGVSRGPIREAFIKLEEEGLIRRAPRHGSYVLGISEADVHEIYGLRQCLEIYAADLNESRLETPYLEQMIRHLEKMVQLREQKRWEESADEDVAFHRVPIVATGHRRLINAWDSLSGSSYCLIAITIARCPDLVTGTRAEHEPIIDAYGSDDLQHVRHAIISSFKAAESLMYEYMKARNSLAKEMLGTV